MKKILRLFLSIVLTILFFNSLQARTKKDSIELLNKKVTDLQLQVELSRSEVQSMRSILDLTNSSISNQLATSANYIAILTLVITVVAIGLGAYITYISNVASKTIDKTKAILIETENIKNEVTLVEASVQRTKALIDNNLSQLYQDLRKEEVDLSLQRLNLYPEDIGHFFGLLATSTLEDKHFLNLKNLAIALKDDNLHRHLPLVLIAQHFPLLSLKDSYTYDSLASLAIVNDLYTQELLIFLNTLCTVIEETNLNTHEKLLKKIFQCLPYKSKKVEDSQEVFEILKTRLNPADKAALINLIDNDAELTGILTRLIDWKAYLI